MTSVKHDICYKLTSVKYDKYLLIFFEPSFEAFHRRINLNQSLVKENFFYFDSCQKMTSVSFQKNHILNQNLRKKRGEMNHIKSSSSNPSKEFLSYNLRKNIIVHKSQKVCESLKKCQILKSTLKKKLTLK